MTKGQKLFNSMIVMLSLHYPHLHHMTVREGRDNAYNNDNWVLHSILNVMIHHYPKYADKTFSYLQSRAGEMEYKELKKNEQDLFKRRNEENGA